MNLFPIEYKIPKAAFDLFRCWTSQFSDREQIIIKNGPIENHFTDQAIEKLIWINKFSTD